MAVYITSKHGFSPQSTFVCYDIKTVASDVWVAAVFKLFPRVN